MKILLTFTIFSICIFISLGRLAYVVQKTNEKCVFEDIPSNQVNY